MVVSNRDVYRLNKCFMILILVINDYLIVANVHDTFSQSNCMKSKLASRVYDFFFIKQFVHAETVKKKLIYLARDIGNIFTEV